MSWLRRLLGREPRYRVQLAHPEALATIGDRKILFHGINKSGSLSLSRMLGAAYAAAGRGASFHSHYAGAAGGRKGDFPAYVAATPGPGFFVGHHLYGAVALPAGDYALVTMFRHPLPRVVSVHRWISNRAARGVQHAGTYRGTLEEFVTRSGGTQYSQVAHFATHWNADRSRVLRGLTGADLFELSVAHIERDVHLAAITEYFEETAFLFAHVCGLPHIGRWQKDDRNKGRTLVHDLPTPLQALIREVFHWDFELYAWARARFLRLVEDAGLRGDIDAYRRDCASQYKDRLL